MTRKRMVLPVVLAALLTSAACGSDNKVGDESLLNFKEQANNRLGETTTTTAAATTTTAAPAVVTTARPKAGAGGAATTTTGRSGSAPTATTAPAPKTAAAAPTQTIREIYIYGDDAAQPLDPQIQTAYVGSIIRWVNNDTVARAVRADSGQFASPMIKPGGSWDYTAGTVGVFAYGDDTRPYVKGELRVAKP
jgi:plastocyanin